MAWNSRSLSMTDLLQTSGSLQVLPQPVICRIEMPQAGEPRFAPVSDQEKRAPGAGGQLDQGSRPAVALHRGPGSWRQRSSLRLLPFWLVCRVTDGSGERAVTGTIRTPPGPEFDAM